MLFWGLITQAVPNYLFNVFFLKCLQLMALPQSACLAEVLAQHVFLPQACHLQWSLTSLQNTFYLHLHMSAKSCPSFALCILIRLFHHEITIIYRELVRKCKGEINGKKYFNEPIFFRFLLKCISNVFQSKSVMLFHSNCIFLESVS